MTRAQRRIFYQYLAPQRKRCGAKTRTPDRHPCQKWALKGEGRCMFHGGYALRGMESPAFRHGRYSRLLPVNLEEMYYRASPERRPRPRVRNASMTGDRR